MDGEVNHAQEKSHPRADHHEVARGRGFALLQEPHRGPSVSPDRRHGADLPTALPVAMTVEVIPAL